MPADDSVRVAADNKCVNTGTSCGLQQGGIYRSPPCMVERAGVPSCATSAPTRHDRGESGPWESRWATAIARTARSNQTSGCCMCSSSTCIRELIRVTDAAVRAERRINNNGGNLETPESRASRYWRSWLESCSARRDDSADNDCPDAALPVRSRCA
jgi:hypothetical protein